MKPDYPLQVGDISFNQALDDPEFKLCNESDVFQYYYFNGGFQYKGEKIKIIEHFKNEFTVNGDRNDNGFITIRFIVNCNGKTGRFRVQEMDRDYTEKVFSKQLTENLLTITKRLDGWMVGEYEGVQYDYYQYLTFKIEQGRLIEIMP